MLPGSIYLALLHCHLPPTSLPAYLPAFRKFLEFKIISLKNTVTSFPFFAKLCHSICIPYIFVLSVVNCHHKKTSKPYMSHILAGNILRDQENIQEDSKVQGYQILHCLLCLVLDFFTFSQRVVVFSFLEWWRWWIVVKRVELNFY